MYLEKAFWPRPSVNLMTRYQRVLRVTVQVQNLVPIAGSKSGLFLERVILNISVSGLSDSWQLVWSWRVPELLLRSLTNVPSPKGERLDGWNYNTVEYYNITMIPNRSNTAKAGKHEASWMTYPKLQPKPVRYSDKIILESPEWLRKVCGLIAAYSLFIY